MTDTIARSIVDFTNGLLKRPLTFTEVTPGGAILCQGVRGGKHVIVVNCTAAGRFWVQSVLKVPRPHARYSWLIGGSPGVNTELVCGWGPVVCYLVTIPEWIEYLDKNYPRENWKKIIGTGALRCPEHLNQEDLLANA